MDQISATFYCSLSNEWCMACMDCFYSLSLSLVCSLSLSLSSAPSLSLLCSLLSLSLSCSLSPPLSLSLSSAPYSHCLDISSFHCLDESSSIYMVVHCFLALFLSQGPDIQTVLANPTVRFFGSCMDFSWQSRTTVLQTVLAIRTMRFFGSYFPGFAWIFHGKAGHCFANSISY